MAGYTQAQIVQIITDEANALGVPVDLALAIARQESGLNPAAAGDGGHSIGLFQLNDQGEGHGMSVAARQDPYTNARIALTQVANVMKASPNLSPGQIAAAAQRPKDRAGYAQAIDSALGQHLSPEQYADMSPEGVLYRTNALSGNGSNGGGGTQNDYGDIDGFLKSQAPALAAAINDPKVHALLSQWGNGQLSDAEFQAQLEATQWWRSTPASQRTVLVEQATDPATARQALDNGAAQILSEAAKKGVAISPQQASDLATKALVNNWGFDFSAGSQLEQQIASFGKYQGDITYKGEAATDVNSLRGIYKSMALPVSDATLNKQLQDVLGGKLTPQQVQDQAAQQAATLYASNPQLAQFLKSGGGTVQDWANPYITRAAQLLGQNADNLDLSAPLWAKVLQPATDPKTGASTGQAMSLDQWETMIRNQPQYGFDTSINGRQQGAQLGGALGKILGTDGL